MSVCISSDGKRVVSWSWDQTVKVWNVERGECEKTLKGHEGWVMSVCISSDGKRVLSGSGDRTVKVWNVERGECEQTLKGHEDWVRSVCISADGKRVLSGSEDQTVKVWKVEKGECIWDIPSVSHLCEEEGGAAMSVCVEFGAQIRIDTRTVHVESAAANMRVLQLVIRMLKTKDDVDDLRRILLECIRRLSSGESHMLSCRDASCPLNTRPVGVGSGAALMDWDMSNSNLTDGEADLLCECLSILTSSGGLIRTLNMSGNAIHRIPESVGSILNLQELDVSNNPLEYVPTTLGSLRGKLHSLRIDTRHASLMTRMFRFGGKTTTLKGKDLDRFLGGGALERFPLPSIKVHLVGRFASGKTTLARLLSGTLKAEDKVKRTPTAAIETTEGLCLSDGDKSVTIRLLDFAGHYEYYASHELFMFVDVGVFVVVVDLSHEEWKSQVNYWLQRLEDLSPSNVSNSLRRVVVVGSHSDKATAAVYDEFVSYVTNAARGCLPRGSNLPDVLKCDLYEQELSRSQIVKVLVPLCHSVQQSDSLPLVTGTFLAECAALKSLREDRRAEMTREYDESQAATNAVKAKLITRMSVTELVLSIRSRVEKNKVGKAVSQTPDELLLSLLEACDEIVAFSERDESGTSNSYAIIEPSLLRLLLFRHFFRDLAVQKERGEAVAAFGSALITTAVWEEAKKKHTELNHFPVMELLENLRLCARLTTSRGEVERLFPSLLSDEYGESPPRPSDTMRVLGRRYRWGCDIPETVFIRLQVELLRQPDFFSSETLRMDHLSVLGIWFWEDESSGLAVEVVRPKDSFTDLATAVYVERGRKIEDAFGLFGRVESLLLRVVTSESYGVSVSERLQVTVLDSKGLHVACESMLTGCARMKSIADVREYSMETLWESVRCRAFVDGNDPMDLLEGHRDRLGGMSGWDDSELLLQMQPVLSELSSLRGLLESPGGHLAEQKEIVSSLYAALGSGRVMVEEMRSLLSEDAVNALAERLQNGLVLDDIREDLSDIKEAVGRVEERMLKSELSFYVNVWEVDPKGQFARCYVDNKRSAGVESETEDGVREARLVPLVYKVRRWRRRQLRVVVVSKEEIASLELRTVRTSAMQWIGMSPVTVDGDGKPLNSRYRNLWYYQFVCEPFGDGAEALDIGLYDQELDVCMDSILRVKWRNERVAPTEVPWSMNFCVYPKDKQFPLSQIGRLLSRLQRWYEKLPGAVKFLGHAACVVLGKAMSGGL